ncbi:MAG: cytochrome P460 family protein [Dechloromonas sp.]|jgi:hypothetical protein|nr:cytochrome P460 family protein [Dechloromonas sp.]
MTRSLLIASLLAAASLPVLADVGYPTAFRHWDHVKSMLINKGHPLYDAVGGLHHLYANPKAVAGYKAGRFADGAVIVFDLFEAVDKENAVGEGARKAVLVMTKDKRKFRATDGWGYQVFDPKTGKGSLDAKAQADCHTCHRAQKGQDFVFSAWRE